MRRQTILRVLFFIITLVFALALPISARWDSTQAPAVNPPNPELMAE